MKKTLYLACFLAIVSALAGGLLAAVNEVTAAKINANALAEVMGSLEKVFPGTTYAEITDYPPISLYDELCDESLLFTP